MAIGLGSKSLNQKLSRNMDQVQKRKASSMEKLATGNNFSQADPRPAERAISEQMEFRLRGLAASKRNINDAVSMLQTAESAMTEINNIIMRMKELNVSAATTTISDQERRYLFIEYQALHDEMNRIAETTEYNGLPVLNGESDLVPEELVFRIDSPSTVDSSDEDLNIIRFDGLKDIAATTSNLGIQSVEDLLDSSDMLEGITLEDVEELMLPEEEGFSTIYDEALNKLSSQRAIFGAMQSRLNHSMNFMDVYQENISAAKSNITDTDYAKEILNVTESNILLNASSGLLAQSNFDANITLNLINSIIR